MEPIGFQDRRRAETDPALPGGLGKERHLDIAATKS